ncbi:MAG TPA: response regulator transcription factor [Candidatus Limnocylindria bacterium]|nr:response regulator transcription factor [Candidatus Limnocylindria bacterium]
MLKLLLVDDHELIRAGLKQLLHTTLGNIMIGEARTAEEALLLLDRQPWDMTITDITLPGRSGLDLLTEFKTLRPSMPVLVLSVLSEDEVAVRVLKAGAAGFVHKETSGDELVKAVRKVLAGGKYVSPSLAEKLALQVAMPQTDEPHKKLSDREYVVMTMLASGTTLTQIGKILSLSIKTISTYRSRILQKMQLDNNAELTRYALKHGLVQ